MENVVKTIESLYESAKKLNAGEGHFEIGGAFHDDKATKILDELWGWAEENNNEQLMDKIKSLAEL